MNVHYSHDKLQVMDIHFPLKASDSCAGIIMIHGGSFAGGDKEKMTPPALQAAGMNYVVLNINYRLAPENRLSVTLQDVRRTVEWIKKNALRFGIDSPGLASYGTSAGAYFSYMLALK